MLFRFADKIHPLSQGSSVVSQIDGILNSYHTQSHNFSFICNGKIVNDFESLEKQSFITTLIPLKGGKGGFGAKLKTEGGKKIKPNENMFSRDANGRRLSFLTVQKQYTEFCKKKIQEDEKVSKEREQFKIMESTLKEGQSFMKLDKSYNREMEETERKLYESIQAGKKYQKMKKEESQEKEELEQKEQLKEERKEDQKVSLKRALPEEYKNESEIEPTKKIKLNNQVSTKQSAKQKFKSLFKK